jgi:CheY-like chemotaxis protein
LVKISVSGTGPGIPADKQAELFQPFSRLGAEVTEIEGTGIGLSLTKKLVGPMGGEHRLREHGGRGQHLLGRDAPGKEKAQEEGIEEALGTLRKKQRLEVGKEGRSLLYVEDNPANLRLMEEIIEQIPNLRMVSAHNAELGVELARKYLPDVILMDINQPGMNGIEALNELKRIRETRAIPVVALSANAMDRDKKKGLEAGFYCYLTKPIDVVEVLTGINAALDEATSRQQRVG